MHVVCKKLIWTLNIIFVQVYPCDKHLQSQKLEWKCFVHFSVKEFLYNIFLSLLLDSVLRSVIPFPHSRFNILRLPSSPLKCALVYRKFFSVKQQLCLYCKRNQTKTCFTGICYQRNYRQHTKVRSVRSNSLSHEAHMWNDFYDRHRWNAPKAIT